MDLSGPLRTPGASWRVRRKTVPARKGGIGGDIRREEIPQLFEWQVVCPFDRSQTVARSVGGEQGCTPSWLESHDTLGVAVADI